MDASINDYRLISLRRGPGKALLAEGREEIGGKAQGLLSIQEALAGAGKT